MYKVVNRTTETFENGLKPNKMVCIKNNIFDTNYFKSEKLGVCEISSEYGEHHVYCYGNIVCTPKTGSDGTEFVITEKN